MAPQAAARARGPRRQLRRRPGPSPRPPRRARGDGHGAPGFRDSVRFDSADDSQPRRAGAGSDDLLQHGRSRELDPPGTRLDLHRPPPDRARRGSATLDGRTIPGTEVLTVSGLPSRSPRWPRLFRDHGWNTVLVVRESRPPSVHGVDSGLLSVWVADRAFGNHQGDGTRSPSRTRLDAVRNDQRPLFLFVNIVTAHGPYQRVPGRDRWLPETPLDLDLFSGREPNRCSLPTPPPASAARGSGAGARGPSGSYSWGVRRADDELEEVLSNARPGWLDRREGDGRSSPRITGSFSASTISWTTVVRSSPEDVDVFAVARGPGFAGTAPATTSWFRARTCSPPWPGSGASPAAGTTRWRGDRAFPRAGGWR